MKLPVKVLCLVVLFLTLAFAQPNVGNTVLPGNDFTMYSYMTPEQTWNLDQHMDGNTVTALITGSIC